MPTKAKTAPKSAAPAPAADESPLISSAEWRKKNGNITARTEYNWEEKGIIPAAIRINGRKYRGANTRPKFDGAV
jgi:hypothetical protein